MRHLGVVNEGALPDEDKVAALLERTKYRWKQCLVPRASCYVSCLVCLLSCLVPHRHGPAQAEADAGGAHLQGA